MGRDELDRLGREELVELILRQRSELAEREAKLADQRRVIAEREARVGELGERVRELEDEVARLSLPPKTPENSSVPPSRGQKANAEGRAGAKRGPERGHVGVSRVRQEPDVILHCRPTVCGGCGAALPEAEQRAVGQSQGSSHDPSSTVTDLPPVRPVVVEPRRTFGPQFEALLGYFREAHHLGYERLEAVCRDLFGLGISQGAIANALGGR